MISLVLNLFGILIYQEGCLICDGDICCETLGACCGSLVGQKLDKNRTQNDDLAVIGGIKNATFEISLDPMNGNVTFIVNGKHISRKWKH